MDMPIGYIVPSAIPDGRCHRGQPAKVTGRELETTTVPTVVTSKAKAKPSKRQAKTEGAMEPSADEFLKVIADQQEKLELAESQVELLTGNTLDFTLAEEAAASLEMARPEYERRPSARSRAGGSGVPAAPGDRAGDPLQEQPFPDDRDSGRVGDGGGELPDRRESRS